MNTIIEKIRAEVESLKIGEPICPDADGYNMAIADVLSVLSDLEKEEKPSEHKDIDTEIGHWMSRLDDKYCMLVNHYSIQDIKDTARHFYELGCRRTAEKYDEIEYKRQRADVCEGLEEEIQKYMSKRWEFGCINPTTPVYLYDFTTDELKECARHFAKWGAEHLRPADGKKWIYEDEYKKDLERLFNDGITIGMTKQKEQMMKEAVEGTLDFNYFGYKVIRPDLKQLDTLLESMNHGDKVKIIIVKED